MNFFRWLRNAVRESFLAGVQDALVELGAADTDNPAEAVAQLRLTLTPPKTDEPARKRKAD